MKGFDQTINIVLEECHERVFSMNEGVQQVVLGLYIVRGDNIVLLGEIDDQKSKSLLTEVQPEELADLAIANEAENEDKKPVIWDFE